MSLESSLSSGQCARSWWQETRRSVPPFMEFPVWWKREALNSQCPRCCVRPECAAKATVSGGAGPAFPGRLLLKVRASRETGSDLGGVRQ